MAANVDSERRPPIIRLIVAASILFCMLCGLGIWQLQRLAWKNAIIADATGRVTSTPVAAPGPDEWATLDMAALRYRPVHVTGRFRHSGEAHVYTSLRPAKGSHSGIGYLIMTPFETETGWTLVVNRGFVPANRKDAASRADGNTDETVTMVGLFRPPQPRNAFTPQDDISGNIWYTRDPVKIALNAGAPSDRIAPYSIDAVAAMTPDGGLPQAGETRLAFTNSHLQYALTWFGLALALAVIVALFVRNRGRI